MKIIKDKNNRLYVDQDLYDYINKIWLSFDTVVPDDSYLYFMKNCTIVRTITDYCAKGIQRVIKKEKAEYCVIQKMNINSYPQYYNGVSITQDDTQEVVYSIYNMYPEQKECIEQILWFIENSPDVKYVNQNKLNESLNNGFIITKDNYTSLKELIDSESTDNHKLAAQMIIQSDLKNNWEWIVYLYFSKTARLSDYDNKNVFYNYLGTLNLGQIWSNIMTKIDIALQVTKDSEVQSRLQDIIRAKFQERIQEYFSLLGTSKFSIEDFKINYNG